MLAGKYTLVTTYFLFRGVLLLFFISSNELSVYDGANSHRKQNTHKVIKYAVCTPLKHGVCIRSSECYRIML